MRAVLCRVNRAAVSVEGQTLASIDRGLLALVAVVKGDGPSDVTRLAERLAVMRLFNDDDGKLNLSLRDIAGGLLLIPNFTIAGRTKKGTRPSFTDAAQPADASTLFQQLFEQCSSSMHVAAGQFGAHMHIDAAFDGPVTVIIDTRQGTE